MTTGHFIMKKKLLTIIGVITGSIILQGCLADLRTAYVLDHGVTIESELKGKAVLNEAINVHGADQFANHSVYQLQGTDVWQGLMGKMGKVWPDNETDILLKYEIGSFNSQVKFESGSRKGEIAGLQSWNYYEKKSEEELEFIEDNKRIVFALSAYQYFTEILNRLNNAPIISYGGAETFDGIEYDLVMASWKTIEPDKEYDQYVLWINKDSHILEFVQYTIRDGYLPGSKMISGTIHYSDYRNINGILIPFTQTIYTFGLNTSENYLHRLTINTFEFDSFDVSELKPDSAINDIGDSKI